jgi:hypothetical protein
MVWSLLGVLLAAVILIAWLLVKRTVRALFRLTRADLLLGVRRLWKASSDRPTRPDRAPVYFLDDYRASRATTGSCPEVTKLVLSPAEVSKHEGGRRGGRNRG